MSNEILEQVTAEVRQFNEETVEPIKKQLASLEERGTSASDEKVTDLESRLTEANERVEGLREEVRLIQAGQQTAAVTKSNDPFQGFIFNDIDTVRNELLHGETRAVNLAAITSAGKLTDETAQAFLDFVVGDQPTLSAIEKRSMNSPTARLDRIGVGTRKLVTQAENTAVADTNGITFGAHTLTVKEAVWGEDISLSFLEDNIAGANAEQQIASVVAKAIGEELNDLAWTGTHDDGTEWIKINEGFETLFVADGDVKDVDLSGNTVVPALSALYSTMPSQYRTISDQRFFVSPGFATSYMDALGGRATALGDSVTVSGASNLAYFGVPITVDRHLPTDSAYMTPASNLVFGVHRDVTQELDWNPRKRQIELTVSIRFDYEYKFGGVVARGHTLDAFSD